MYQLFINCLSTLSTFYQLFINVVSTLSTVYQLSKLVSQYLVVHSLVEEAPGIADLLQEPPVDLIEILSAKPCFFSSTCLIQFYVVELQLWAQAKPMLQHPTMSPWSGPQDCAVSM